MTGAFLVPAQNKCHFKMNNVVKCNVCNIVIDELLAYMQNKLSLIDEPSLVRICASVFTVDEIRNSKRLLFDAIPTDMRRIVRKNSGKEIRDLEDIIGLLKTTEVEVIPTFVARQLDRLPPLTLDHLDCSKLLKDLTRLQSEIEAVKTSYATLRQLEDLRSDMQKLKFDSLAQTPVCNVNMKRGAWNKRAAWNMDSGPVGLSMHNSTMERTNESTQHKTNEFQNDNTNNQKEIGYIHGGNQQSGEMSHTSPAAASYGARPIPTDDQLTGSDGRTGAQPKSTVNTNNSQNTHEDEVEDDGEGPWKVQTKRKSKLNHRFGGRMGAASKCCGKFKAAEKKLPIFITNIHKDTVESDIVDYIRSKTKETVSLKKIVMKKQTNYNAYKFFVAENNIQLYLDEKMWPQGIIFRRFVHYKQ